MKWYNWIPMIGYFLNKTVNFGSDKAWAFPVMFYYHITWFILLMLKLGVYG